MQLFEPFAAFYILTIGVSAAWIPRPFQPISPLATSFPDPNSDPFYNVPSDIANYTNGEVLRSRAVVTTVVGRAVESYQVFYRTTDHQDNASGTVATIWVPAVPSSPPKILSIQSAEDALNIDCAPSWAWVNASSVLEAYYSYDASLIIPWALARGYYVVNADDEGRNSAWLVGLTEGRAALDGIRAAINHLHLPTLQTMIALYGYSGGAHTTAWASTLAAAYARELNVVAAAFGGTPIDLGIANTTLNGGPASLLATGGLIGLANGIPELNATMNTLLTPTGVATVARLRAPNMCLNAHPELASINFTSLFTQNPWNNPTIARLVADESLLSNVSTLPVPVPQFPRYEWHGMDDQTVPYAQEAQYVAQQCAAGADIRFLSLPGLGHGPASQIGAVGAAQFVQNAFEGTLSNVTCGANVTIPTIGSTEAIEVLGVDANIVLGALLAAELA